MRSVRSLPLAAGLVVLAANACHADVIIKLRSGVEVRAMRTWTDGDTVKAQLHSGVIGLPSDSIASMTEVAAIARPPVTVAPSTAAAVGAASSAPRAAAPVKPAKGAANEANGAPAAAPPVAEHIPDVPGEDALTKMERLDALSLKTHRELSIARTQEQPQDVLESLQRKLDDINEQREATMRRLGRLR